MSGQQAQHLNYIYISFHNFHPVNDVPGNTSPNSNRQHCFSLPPSPAPTWTVVMNVFNSLGALKMGGRANKTAISQFTLNCRERAVDGGAHSDTNGQGRMRSVVIRAAKAEGIQSRPRTHPQAEPVEFGCLAAKKTIYLNATYFQDIINR